jgi:hypothetical protein
MAREGISPLPWWPGPHYKTDIESGSGRVGESVGLLSPRGIANVAFICECVNNYDRVLAERDALLRACQAFLDAYEADEDGSYTRAEYYAIGVMSAAVAEAEASRG